jgi:hypothetical protein
MQMLSYLWSFVVGDSDDNKTLARDPVLSIEPHNTPGKYNFYDARRWEEALVSSEKQKDAFLAMVVLKEDWEKTSGDVTSSSGQMLVLPASVVSRYIEENVLTDGTVRSVARMRLAANGSPGARFFDAIVDDEYVIVFFNFRHFAHKLVTVDGKWPVLSEPLNKTRDPFSTVSPSCRIERSRNTEYAFAYRNEALNMRLITANYNKECSRLGKSAIVYE